MILHMIILGPKQLGNDIDVYLRTLIKDLNILLEEGVDVDDAYSGENVKMHSILFCTINDLLTYGNLSRYNVKGHKVCPTYEVNTCSHQIKNEKRLFTSGIKIL